MIKLVALDMDGTLLNSQTQITPITEKLLKYLHENGIYIVLASGRPIKGLRPFIEQLSLTEPNDYSINYNGSFIIHNIDQSSIFQKMITGKQVLDAYLFSKQIHTNFYFYSADDVITYQNESPYIDIEKNLVKLPTKQIEIDKMNLEDSFIKMAYVDHQDVLNSIEEKVKERFSPSLSVVRTHKNFLEMFNKETNKGTALKYLCKYLNISQEEVLAFGDNDNDYELLLQAKYKIVMGNSPSIKLRSIATEITKSNDEDGVAYILDKYIKQGLFALKKQQ